jgi:hypothetical protein
MRKSGALWVSVASRKDSRWSKAGFEMGFSSENKEEGWWWRPLDTPFARDQMII